MDGNKGDIRFLLFALSPFAAHSFNEAAIKGFHTLLKGQKGNCLLFFKV